MVRPLARFAAAATLTLAAAAPIHGQGKTALPPLPAPLGLPAPGAVTAAPYAPQPIVPGGIVVPLYPPGSPLLKADRVREAETYNLSQSVPGRISSIVNIHNPSDRVPHRRSRHQHRGGGDPRRRRRPQHAQRRHRERRLRAVLLQLRRQHGDPAQPPAQGRLRRRRRRRHRRAAGDPAGAGARRGARDRPAQDRHHGLLGGRRAVVGDGGALRRLRREARRRVRSAGRRLVAAGLRRHHLSGADAVREEPRRAGDSQGRAAGVHRQRRLGRSRPRDLGDGLLRGDAAARRAEHRDAPLRQRPPPRRRAARRQPQSGGLTDRGDIPLGTWQARFVDWFRDLGFLQKPGVETKAAKDVAAFVATPPPSPR